jgi:hypothetical protein
MIGCNFLNNLRILTSNPLNSPKRALILTLTQSALPNPLDTCNPTIVELTGPFSFTSRVHFSYRHYTIVAPISSHEFVTSHKKRNFAISRLLSFYHIIPVADISWYNNRLMHFQRATTMIWLRGDYLLVV